MSIFTSSIEPSDAFLLERAGRGDARAYELIYDRHRHSAYALAERICGRRCVAEEVVQEAFLSVWRRAFVYEHSRGSARAWILAIVRNRAIDERRRRHRGGRSETNIDDIEELSGTAMTDSEVERREHSHAVRAALRVLPAAQCEALVLSHYAGLSNRETAALVGRSLGTVKGRIRLGHARLRRDLASLDGTAA
jgi:RNA polymerase sigma-70 factor (ECF subfamily)